ncbi:MAG TPA: hypothetical protein VFI46_18055 [Jiangellaceae bacterium]|nr:hypothetical protein [Jiangellaceae bacterium]
MGHVHMIRTTTSLVRDAHGSQAYEAATEAFRRQVDQANEMIMQALAAVIDKLGLTDPWRIYAAQVYRHAVLILLDDDDAGDEPRPPKDDLRSRSTTSSRDPRSRPDRQPPRCPATSRPWTTTRCDRWANWCSTSWRDEASHDRIPTIAAADGSALRRTGRIRRRDGSNGC